MFCVLAYKMEKMAEIPVEDPTVDMQEMSWFILQNVTQENMEMEGLEGVCFREGKSQQVFLIWAEPKAAGEKDGREEKENKEERAVSEAVKRVLNSSTEFIRRHFNFPYQAAVSEVHYGTSQIYQAYQEAVTVFEYQKKEEGKHITGYGEINLLPVDTLLKYPIDVENRLIHSIRSGDGEGACQEIRQLLKDNQINCLAPEAMQFLVSNIAASIIRAAGKGVPLPISQKALMEACRRGGPKLMQEELERFAAAVCQKMAEFNKKEKENQKGRLYQEIKAYVEGNYSDVELSVNSMAEQFGVQPTYLSKLFKEMEGEKLSQYIHQIRLSHAKRLLLAEEDKLLEDIALECGFGSHRTFLRIFKQYEGLTPTQYKELEEKKGKEEEDS